MGKTYKTARGREYKLLQIRLTPEEMIDFKQMCETLGLSAQEVSRRIFVRGCLGRVGDGLVASSREEDVEEAP